jgi:hypothetical protein
MHKIAGGAGGYYPSKEPVQTKLTNDIQVQQQAKELEEEEKEEEIRTNPLTEQIRPLVQRQARSSRRWFSRYLARQVE